MFEPTNYIQAIKLAKHFSGNSSIVWLNIYRYMYEGPLCCVAGCEFIRQSNKQGEGGSQ